MITIVNHLTDEQKKIRNRLWDKHLDDIVIKNRQHYPMLNAFRDAGVNVPKFLNEVMGAAAKELFKEPGKP